MAEEGTPLPEPTSTAPTTQILDTNSEEQSPPTFVLFPKLAPELRIKIWRLSIPETRVVRILAPHYALDPPDAPRDEHGFHARWCFKSSSTDTIPAIFHTNHESQAEGLKMYSLCMGNRLLYPIYFNFASDFILLKDRGAFWRFELPDPVLTDAAQEDLVELRSKLRHLIIAEDEYTDTFHALALRDSSEYRHLKTLIFPKWDKDPGVPWGNATRR
jgi:hypothetical protein